MYEYNNPATNGYNQVTNTTVPNVMMDDNQTYGAQTEVPLDIGQVTVSNNDTTELPMYATVKPEGPQFDIPDLILRRAFVRKIYTLLVLQYIFAIILAELILLCIDGQIDGTIFFSFEFLRYILWALMYAFSEFRRHAPMNWLVLGIDTIMMSISQAIYVNIFGTQTIMLLTTATIIQLLILIAFSKQHRFQFNNFNADVLMLVVLMVCALTFGILWPEYLIHVGVLTVLPICYIVYDTYLLMTGFHGYNLKPEEYIFAAFNIHADITNLSWRIIRYLIIDRFVEIFYMIRQCCFSDVC